MNQYYLSNRLSRVRLSCISRLTRTPTVKNLVGGRTYYFQVLANSATNFGASDQVKFPVPARVKHKAITAGVVGGILFFLVAIILSICAVKICNKRKRRKQEKGMDAPWRYRRIVHLPAIRLDLCSWLCRLYVDFPERDRDNVLSEKSHETNAVVKIFNEVIINFR